MTKLDGGVLLDHASVGADTHRCDAVHWKCEGVIKKFWTPQEEFLKVATAEELLTLADHEQLQRLIDAGLEPYETRYTDNLLTYGGASLIWEALIGATFGTDPRQFLNTTNAYIGVGTGVTAAAAGDTTLQTETTRKQCTAVTHTDATTSGGASCAFVTTFGTSDANVHWQEWGILNKATVGRLLNHKVEDLGTKTSAASWQFTVTLTLS